MDNLKQGKNSPTQTLKTASVKGHYRNEQISFIEFLSGVVKHISKPNGTVAVANSNRTIPGFPFF